jgi:hypothetical protein
MVTFPTASFPDTEKRPATGADATFRTPFDDGADVRRTAIDLVLDDVFIVSNPRC